MKSLSVRTVIKRINRRLAHDDLILRAVRGQHEHSYLGWYYVTGLYNRTIEWTHENPATTAREMGLIRADEMIEGEANR